MKRLVAWRPPEVLIRRGDPFLIVIYSSTASFVNRERLSMQRRLTHRLRVMYLPWQRGCHQHGLDAMLMR